VTAITPSGRATFDYDVKYVLGNTETLIKPEHISHYQHLERTRRGGGTSPPKLITSSAIKENQSPKREEEKPKEDDSPPRPHKQAKPAEAPPAAPSRFDLFCKLLSSAMVRSTPPITQH
jgi:hypothetical protein